MPELAKIGPPGGIDVPGAVQVPRQGAALEEFRRASEETGRMGALVMAGIRRLKVENTLAAAGAQANQAYLINDADQTRQDKYLNMPDLQSATREWVKDRASATDKINQGIVANYKDMSPELGPYLKKLANEHTFAALQRFKTDYEGNARAQFAGPTTQAVVNDVLSTKDDDLAGKKQAQHEEAIKRVPGFLPNERMNMLASFRKDIAEGRLENHARDNPEEVLNMDKPPPDVSPGKFNAVRDNALVQLTLGHRVNEASLKADQDQNEAQAMNLLRQGRTAEAVALANKMMPFGRMTPEGYRGITGHNYRDQTDPVLDDMIGRQIDNMTPDEAESVRGVIQSTALNPAVNPRSVAFWNERWQAKNREFTSDLKVATATMRASLTDAHLQMAANQDKLDRLPLKDVDDHFQALISTAKTPKDVLDARNETLKYMEDYDLSLMKGGGKTDAIKKFIDMETKKDDAWRTHWEGVGLPAPPLRTRIVGPPPATAPPTGGFRTLPMTPVRGGGPPGTVTTPAGTFTREEAADKIRAKGITDPKAVNHILDAMGFAGGG